MEVFKYPQGSRREGSGHNQERAWIWERRGQDQKVTRRLRRLWH